MDRIWATLLTSGSYLPGVLVLNWALQKHHSKYPLFVLYTSELDQSCVTDLINEGINVLKIDTLLPANAPNLSMDPRFHSTWSKLALFSLTQFKRVVQLDCDMLPINNMDELLELDLNGSPFASTHACVCNPNKFEHYPVDWNCDNCVFTNHDHYLNFALETHAQVSHESIGPLSMEGLSKCNSGILVVEPNMDNFNLIQTQLLKPTTMEYQFPDQDLLADLFYKQWLSISYTYNTLKTFQTAHPTLWDLNKIKNIHYILSPKPWNVKRGEHVDPSFELWWDANDARVNEKYLSSLNG